VEETDGGVGVVDELEAALLLGDEKAAVREERHADGRVEAAHDEAVLEAGGHGRGRARVILPGDAAERKEDDDRCEDGGPRRHGTGTARDFIT